MSTPRRRLLTIAHSYAVALNRRLAHEVAAAGGWEVTAVAPARFRGDFGWHATEARPGEACRVVPVPVHCSSRIHVMRYGRQLAELLREQWDLVHAWEEPYVASAAQIARAVPRGVPLVFATFQNIAKRYPPPFNWIERSALKRADGMIAFGHTAADVLRARGFDERPVRVIPPGVDVTHFSPDRELGAAVRAELGWSDQACSVVGFVGRLVPEKGIATLMRALDRLDQPWRALLVGSGPLEPDVRAWSLRYGDRVSIQTAVAHEDVRRFLNAMDLVSVPSRTTPRWREQFGRVLIEAFACGVPVVASTSGEMPFVVADAGMLVAEDDVDGWANAIGGLAANPSRRAALSRAGRRRAESVYAWPVVARRHVDLFEELIESVRQ